MLRKESPSVLGEIWPKPARSLHAKGVDTLMERGMIEIILIHSKWIQEKWPNIASRKNRRFASSIAPIFTSNFTFSFMSSVISYFASNFASNFTSSFTSSVISYFASIFASSFASSGESNFSSNLTPRLASSLCLELHRV